ncbi:MAG TPA: Hsp20/alpha crystallin family protein [Thermoplasmata archaeon]|jgi:HSP20 family protein|nr:Hsp20/alpha crystallin family protein [Thermoplasmata archaeon]
MDPFDDENHEKKKNPHDPFRDDDIFRDIFKDDRIRDIFNDDKIMDDIKKMAEEMMKMFTNAQPGKPIVHGYKIEFGPDGKPQIADFGNRSVRSPEGVPSISDEIEPLTDIIEGENDVAITVEIPGVEKEDINLVATEDILEIKVDSPKRKYHKRIDLPCNVKTKSTKATYKNGILDIVLDKKEKKKDNSGYKVSIE